MTALERALSDYLTLRRRLGYKLGRPGQLLGQFVAYLDDVGADTVTIERAVDWATEPAGADPNWWAYRLDAVRGFAAYPHTLDPAVPELPRDLLPHRSRRATPYLYSDDELAALIAGAGGSPACWSCAGASSQRRASCRCTPPPSRRLPNTSSGASDCAHGRARRRCSCRGEAPASATATSPAPSMS